MASIEIIVPQNLVVFSFVSRRKIAPDDLGTIPRFLCEIKLSLYTVWCKFCDLIFQKCSEHDRIFNILKCKPSSGYSTTFTFCRQLFPDRDPDPRKHRPYFSDPSTVATLPEKTQRQRVFSPVNSRASELLHSPTTWWWYGWHDDVIDMMVGMLTMIIVRNLEVF